MDELASDGAPDAPANPTPPEETAAGITVIAPAPATDDQITAAVSRVVDERIAEIRETQRLADATEAMTAELAALRSDVTEASGLVRKLCELLLEEQSENPPPGQAPEPGILSTEAQLAKRTGRGLLDVLM